MSAQEEAARLNQLGQHTHAQGMVREAIEALGALAEEVQSALGPGHSKLEEARAPLMAAIDQANTLNVTIQGALENLKNVASQIG